MTRLKRKWVAVGVPLAALCVVGWLHAGEVVDRIAAVVNERVILLSEVDEKVFILQAQGELQGKDSTQVAGIRRDILDRLVEEELVVQRAKSRGLTVEPSEVTEAVDKAVEKVRSSFPDEAAFQAALAAEGISLLQLRERYQNDVEQERLAQRVVAQEIRSKVEVTTEEVQKYYKEHHDEIPPSPPEVRLAHIVVEPQNPKEMAAAEAAITRARERLEAGEEFAAVVADYNGGDLGNFCAGDLDPQIEDVLAWLQPGELSKPTRSGQGWHIFEVLDRDDKGCVTVRHLFVPVVTSEEDVRLAAARAEEARTHVLAGEQFATVAADMSDDDATREQGGDLGWAPVPSLLPEVSAQLDSLGVGDVSRVVRSERGFHVFQLLERREGGEMSFEEIRDRLRQFMEQQKLEEAYTTWLNAVKDSAYVEIIAWSR